MNTLQNVGHQTLQDWFNSLLKHYSEGVEYSSNHPKLSKQSTAILGFFILRTEQFVGKNFSIQLFGALLKLSADELMDDNQIQSLFGETAQGVIESRNLLIEYETMSQAILHQAMLNEGPIIGKVLFGLEGKSNLDPVLQQIQRLPQFQKI